MKDQHFTIGLLTLAGAVTFGMIVGGAVFFIGTESTEQFEPNELISTVSEKQVLNTQRIKPEPGTSFVRNMHNPTSGEFIKVESTNGEVIINGKNLTAEELAKFLPVGASSPMSPGNYWYDSVSGMFGIMGYPTLGILPSDLIVSALAKNSSAGDTGIIINGRELSTSELQQFSANLSIEIPIGSYEFLSSGELINDGDILGTVNLKVNTSSNKIGNPEDFKPQW